MNQVRVWMTAVGLAALGLIYVAGTGSAGGEGSARAVVEKIAAAVKQGDMATAKKLAAAYAKKADGVEDVMEVFKPKNKGGIGFGKGATDGIEKALRAAARDGAKAKDAANYEEAAYVITAVGLITDAYAPNVKESAKKKRKNWEKASHDMNEAAEGMVKAAKSKAAADLKTAATRVNNACTACHADFRE